MDMWLSWLLRPRDLAPLGNLMSSTISIVHDNGKPAGHHPAA
jgi:hypothetical protein